MVVKILIVRKWGFILQNPQISNHKNMFLKLSKTRNKYYYIPLSRKVGGQWHCGYNFPSRELDVAWGQKLSFRTYKNGIKKF